MEDMDALPIGDIGIKLDSAVGATPIGWPVGSKVTLCNVPWDSEYANVVEFEDTAARDAYFDSLAGESVELDRLTYCFPNEPVRVGIPYSSAYTYNYVCVENPKLPTDTADPVRFFYFIDDVVFTAPSTTTLYLQLDVWTTYRSKVELGRGFVERGHVAWHAYSNSKLTTQDRKRRYMCVPEGLDVGSNYVSTNMELHSAGGGASVDEGATQWTIIICSAVNLRTEDKTLDEKFGTVDAPKLQMAKGMNVDGIPSGCAVYGMEAGHFPDFVANLADYPWISTNILSVTAMPEGAIEHGTSVEIAKVPAYRIKSQGTAHATPTTTIPSNGLNSFISANLEEGWTRHPKSSVYPYTYLCADNLCATPVTYKPELFADEQPEWANMNTVCPPFQRMLKFPLYYAAGSKLTQTYSKYRIGDDSSKTFRMWNGWTLNNALIWDDFPQFAILNDEYQNYLASNARTIKYQRDSAGWGLDRAKAQAQLSYDNSMRSIDASTEQQDLQYRFEKQRARKTSVNSTLNAASDLATQLGSSADFLKGTTDLIRNTVKYTTGMAAANLGQEQFDVGRAAQTENAGANYKTALWAAKGDYQNTIAGINATCQDAQLLPPTQSGTVSGGMYASLGQLGMTNWTLQSYTLTPDYRKLIADYWNRFGYSVNEYMVPTSLQLMSSFTYWKFQDLIVSGTDLPETYRLSIKGIFEKGVTVFSNPDDIGGGMDVMDGNEPLASAALY